MRRLILALLFTLAILTGTFLFFSIVHAYVFSGNLKPGDYSASHTLHLSQDSALRIKISHDATLYPHSFEIWTADDGDAVWQATNLKFQTSGTEYGPFPLKSGTYVIFITASWAYGGEGNYTMALTLTPTDFPNDKEPNNSIPQAQSITPIGFTSGHLGYSGKLDDSIEKDYGDYFEFTLPGECDFYIEMNYDDSLVGYSFAIYDSNVKWVLTEWLRTGLDGEMWGPYRLESGTYYVKMAGPGEKYGGYEFITITDPKDTAADPPFVSSTDPLPNERNVDIYYIKENGIKVTFSQEMYRYSFEPVFHDQNIMISEGDEFLYISAEIKDRVLWMIPAEPLKPFTTYTCKVKSGENGVKDVEGQPMATDFTWSFTTGKDPWSKQAFINVMNMLLLLSDP